jgi:glycerol-3-phosphate acyltransferase PlsY
MNILYYAVYILAAYLFGAIPHLVAIARLQHIPLTGDHHQTLFSKGNKTLAVLGVIGEFAKGAIPVMVGRLLDVDTTVIAIAGLAAVCGQMWPVFQKFDGEKGNSIGLGMAAALSPFALLWGLFPLAIGAGIRIGSRVRAQMKNDRSQPIVGGAYSRIMPIAMMTGFTMMPVVAWILDEPLAVTLVLAGMVLLFFIRRATAGLSYDLKISRNVGQVLAGRLLYDRSIREYRVK